LSSLSFPSSLAGMRNFDAMSKMINIKLRS
jgi:hypothetical protein